MHCMTATATKPARRFPVRRAYFRRKLAAELPMRDAIHYRREAAYATSDAARRFLRAEMRYYAQRALEEVRRYIRNEATNAHPELY